MNSWIRSKSKAVWIVGGGLLIVLAILWLVPKSSKPSVAKPTAPNVSSAPSAETATAEGQSMETTETTVLPAVETEESAAQAFLRRVAEATNPRNIAARNTATKENLEKIRAEVKAEVMEEMGIDYDYHNFPSLEEKLQMSREEREEYQRNLDKFPLAMALEMEKMADRVIRPYVREGEGESFQELMENLREGVEQAKEFERDMLELKAGGARLDEELTSWMTPAQKEQHEQEMEQWRKAQLKQAIEILQQGGKPPWEEAAEAVRAGKTPKPPIAPPSAP